MTEARKLRKETLEACEERLTTAATDVKSVYQIADDMTKLEFYHAQEVWDAYRALMKRVRSYYVYLAEGVGEGEEPGEDPFDDGRPQVECVPFDGMPISERGRHDETCYCRFCDWQRANPERPHYECCKCVVCREEVGESNEPGRIVTKLGKIELPPGTKIEDVRFVTKPAIGIINTKGLVRIKFV